MNIKKVTFALLITPIFSSLVFAEDHVETENVDNVKFDQHFKSNQSFLREGESNKDIIFNSAIKPAAKSMGTSVLMLTSTSVFNKRYQRFSAKAQPLLGKGNMEATALLKKAKLNYKLANASAAGIIYFIFDSASGVVVTMAGSRPVYAANAPALVAYVAREGVENVGQALNALGNAVKPLPAAAQKELENIKKTILGQQ